MGFTGGAIAAALITSTTSAVVANQNRIAGEKQAQKNADAQNALILDAQNKQKDEATLIQAQQNQDSLRQRNQRLFGGKDGRDGTIATSPLGVVGSGSSGGKTLLGV